MKKATLLFFSLLLSSCFAAPVVFYDNYEAYKAKSGQTKGEFQQFSISENHTSIWVLDSNKKVGLHNKELEKPWGIEIDGVLFRYSKGVLYEALYLGEKISVFENAHNRIEALNENKNYTPGQANHIVVSFCKGTEGKLELLTSSVKGKIKNNIRNKYPDFSILFDEIEKVFHDKHNYTTQKVLNCFVEFDQQK